MQTLQQIKDDYAKEIGYPSYEEMENWYIDNNTSVNAAILIRSAWEEMAKRYAIACCRATLERAARDPDEEIGQITSMIWRDSIINPDNIVIL